MIAVCIIIAALLISVTRLLTPVLDTHRNEIEAWASKLLDAPVTIQKVEISWYQYQPEVSLNKVTIIDKSTNLPSLQIEKIRVFFSVPQSLWQRKLVPSGIIISGSDINIYQNTKGEYSVQGFPSLGGFNQQPYKQETKFRDVFTWLSTQPQLTLQNVDLRYTDSANQKKFVTLYELSFINTNDQHVVTGKGILHQDIPTELTAAVQWRGDTLDLAKIRAKIYLYASGVSLMQWVKGYSWNGWQINNGIVSAKIWATWKDGMLHRVQTTFQLYGLDLYSATDKSTHKINRLSGNAGWKHEGKNYIFAGDDIFIDLPTHLWPATSFYVALAPGANGDFTPKAINFGYVNINDAQAFLFSSPPVLPDSVRQILTKLKLKGDLQNAAITFADKWNDWSHISLNANFIRLQFSPWHGLPGVSNLSGLVKWNGTQGDLSLQSAETEFQYDSIFTKPVTIEQLTGDVQWLQDKNKDWMLRIPALHIFNTDFAANLSGTLSFPAKASPVADLHASFTIPKLSHITRYLPMRIFDADLVTWLQNAFKSGEAQSGNAVLRGPLSDIPFDKGNGQLLLSTEVKNVDLLYAPDWPVLQNLNANLNFSGRKMTVELLQAQLMDVKINNTKAVIPYFGADKPQILEVQTSDIQTDFAQGLQFVHASPLEKTIGKMFSDTEMHGPIVLKLGLIVPLAHPDKIKVQGNIAMSDVEMNLVPWKLIVNNLKGQVHFTEDSTDASGITGVVFNKPLVLNLATIQKTKSISVARASLETNLSVSDLESWLKLPISQVAQGSTDVSTQIDFSLHTPIEVQMESRLEGISVNLPDQFAKKADEKRDFSANIIIQEKQPLRMKASYGDLLNVALILDKKDEKFNLVGADLRLGSGEASWPAGAGIYITGNFATLDWDKIKSYMGQSGSVSLPGMSLKGIDISASTLNIGGQQLQKVRLQVTPAQNMWNVDITSPDISGQIKIPVKWLPQNTITAQFQRLNLRSAADTSAATPMVEVKSLPSIIFSANSVSVNGLPLGQVNFKTIPRQNGLSIQSLTISSPRVDFHANGDWTQTSNRYLTHLQGVANSPNVSNLLNSFGFDVHNFISSSGKLTFDLSWQAAPYAPALSSLNGNATLAMKQGRIADVGEANGAKMDLGRFLSIFSLQTIPRRLSFDFSDIFQKGYSFDSLRGNFNLQHGNAFTTNTTFEGPVARVMISGRIGLATKDADFTLSVTPLVTSSIPVAATLITMNPLVGLAAFGVNTVLNAGVNQAATYYSVDGEDHGVIQHGNQCQCVSENNISCSTIGPNASAEKMSVLQGK